MDLAKQNIMYFYCNVVINAVNITWSFEHGLPHPLLLTTTVTTVLSNSLQQQLHII